MTAEHNGADALMAALTDEPLTDEARADAAFMAEHRSAAADVALLREQLGIIGDALAAEPVKVRKRAEKPVAVRPSWRHGFKIALSGLAVACAVAMFAGMGWLIAQSGGMGAADGGSSDSAGEAATASKDGTAQYLACARIVVEGTVVAVDPLPGSEQDRVTLDVTRYYKPAEGKKEITFLTGDPGDSRIRKDAHLLIGIPDKGAVPDKVIAGEQNIARERARLSGAESEAADLDCA
ncbi:hypothetical protein AB0L99_20055 [Streptomyces sp. NPDC051954]|uniref:hypothetical protein n=1 Tax=unclassified Streptomyces TaxID=2593676 RepID=UPI00343EE1D9